MKLYEIQVDTKQINNRLSTFQMIAKRHNSKVMIGIKDNCNGWGTVEAYNYFKKLGVKDFFCAYPGEFNQYGINTDLSTNKFAWTWRPDENWASIPNLTLVCSNMEQVEFCRHHKIPYYIWFDLGMTRNGFIFDSSVLQEVSENGCINVFSHCPYSDGKVKIYEEQARKLLTQIEAQGITVKETSFLASNPALTLSEETDDTLFGSYIRVSMGLTSNYDYFNNGYCPRSVKTWVMNVREIPFGTDYFPIGYDTMNAVEKGIKRVAVIPVGYYHFIGIKKVAIKDQLFDVVAYMQDSMVIDITGSEWVRENDEVEIIGPRTYKYNHLDGYSHFTCLQYPTNNSICDIKYI